MYIINKIQEAVNETIGKQGIEQRNTPHCWSKDMEKLIKEKKVQYNKWPSTRDSEDRRQYFRINAEVKRPVPKANSMRVGSKFVKAWTITQEVLNAKKPGKQSKNLRTNRKETSGIKRINA